MKTFFFTLLVFLFAPNIKAQDKLEEASNFAADYLCNCVNKVYSGVEPEIRDLIIKIYYIPTDKQSEFILSLDEEVRNKIITQSLILVDEKKVAEIDECNNNMIKEFEKKYKNIKAADISEEKIIDAMAERLKSKKKCEFAYMLMKIGMEQQKNNVNGNDGGEEGQ